MSMMKARGFTLIEILLVVGLISVLAGIGMVTFNKANQRQKLAAQTEKIVDYLQKAQNYAVSGVTISGTAVDAFYFEATRSTNGFALGYRKTLVDTSLEGSLTLTEPVKFKGSGAFKIYFSLPLGKMVDASLTPLSVSQTVDVCLSDVGYYTITIEPAGKIYKSGLQTGGICP